MGKIPSIYTPADMTTGFPPDCMQPVCLGVTQKMPQAWPKGGRLQNFRLHELVGGDVRGQPKFRAILTVDIVTPMTLKDGKLWSINSFSCVYALFLLSIG